MLLKLRDVLRRYDALVEILILLLIVFSMMVVANTDWQDEIYRTGSTFENNLSFSGGSQKSLLPSFTFSYQLGGCYERNRKRKNNCKNEYYS